MDVRVWGVAEDRLIELRLEPAEDGGAGMRIEGLPDARAQTTADRVRAALLNSGLVGEAPTVAIRLDPVVTSGTTSDLDLPIALAALVWVSVIGTGLGWILAAGRLGLNGAVHAAGPEPPPTLAEVVASLCRTQVIGFEHMFGRTDG